MAFPALRLDALLLLASMMRLKRVRQWYRKWGKLNVSIEKVFPLQDVAQAHKVSEDRHVRGKLVLAIA